MSRYPRRDFLKTAGGAAVGLAGVMAAPYVLRGSQGKRRIKIGQIGTGHGHAAGKLETLLALPDDFEVVGIVESDPKLRQAAEAEKAFRGLPWMTEEQLLNTPGLEAVAVETRNAQLVATAARCVAAGKHVHLDKPAGVSLSSYKKVLDDAQRQKLTIQMGFMFRYNPAFQRCFRAAREGWLGEIFELNGVISKRVEPSRREFVAGSAGGTMFELGCHLIDAMLTLLGRPDKVTPYVRRTRAEDNLADNQLAVFEYPKAICTIRSSVVEVEGEQRRQFTVCGQQGTVDIKPLEPPTMLLALSEPRGDYRRGYQEVTLPTSDGRYHEQLRDFARILRGEKEQEYSPAHDLLVCETTLLASGMPLEP
jgi:predicted dehydrogenase